MRARKTNMMQVSKRKGTKDKKTREEERKRKKAPIERNPDELKKNSLKDGNSLVREVENRRLY